MALSYLRKNNVLINDQSSFKFSQLTVTKNTLLFFWLFAWYFCFKLCSVQLLSCVRLCDPMNCSIPGLPVQNQLPEFTQTHVHRVSDAIQPSHPLSSPSPLAFNLSQHQGLFQWVWLSTLGGQNIGASVLPMNVQGWLPSGLTGLISLLPKGLSRVFSNTTNQKHHNHML